MHSDDSVRKATLADRATVTRTLARAFDRDPVTRFLVRQDAARDRAMAIAFDMSFRWLTLPFGEAWVAGDGAGAALWTPPGAWSAWRAIIAGPRLAYAVGVSRLPKVLAAVARTQNVHPREPHWYLFAIGVDPSAQGHGYGSALLRSVLAQCDARREPAYLEASTRDNARLYVRHGFRETGEISLADDGPRVWPMWRDPR